MFAEKSLQLKKNTGRDKYDVCDDDDDLLVRVCYIGDDHLVRVCYIGDDHLVRAGQLDILRQLSVINGFLG